MLSDGGVCFCTAAPPTSVCRSAMKSVGMVFSNISPAHDLDIASLLVRCVGDTQLGSLLMHWMTESGFKKISTGRTDELQFRRLNLIGINVNLNSCTWVQKKKNHICLTPIQLIFHATVWVIFLKHKSDHVTSLLKSP